jgi:hypothetical protein
MSNLNHYHSHKHDVTVNEHKAPTDESVRLLNEILEKAKKNIVKNVQVSNNILNFESLFFEDYFVGNRLELYANFKLNGHYYEVKSEINYDEFNKWDGKNMLQYFCLNIILETLSKAISEQILINFKENVLKQIEKL